MHSQIVQIFLHKDKFKSLDEFFVVFHEKWVQQAFVCCTHLNSCYGKQPILFNCAIFSVCCKSSEIAYNQAFIASSTATAQATVAPTMGLLPICCKIIFPLLFFIMFYISSPTNNVFKPFTRIVSNLYLLIITCDYFA